MELDEYTAENVPELEALFSAGHPFVIRGLVNNWPLKKAGESSFSSLSEYLLSHVEHRKFVTHIGNYDDADHIGYTDGMEMNFLTEDLELDKVLGLIGKSCAGGSKDLVYVSSVDVDKYFRNLGDENQVDLGGRSARAGIWIGSKTTVPTHFDFPDNLACVAVGCRRFTLFPPEQIKNLYPGPLDKTPAGRSISLVDLEAPDFDLFPKFKEAKSASITVDLAPGDAIHIPSMWWHSVSALSEFNVLVNYWWRDSTFGGEPDAALIHAILAIRDLPDHKRRLWSNMFDHYVFDYDKQSFDYIPENARGILAPLTPSLASRIKNFLRHVIN